jgi:hypothetical protein
MKSTNIAEAAHKRNWEKARQLVEKGYDVNAVSTEWNRTGLH